MMNFTITKFIKNCLIMCIYFHVYMYHIKYEMLFIDSIETIRSTYFGYIG